MTRTTAQQALQQRCDLLVQTTAAGEGHLAVAELATHGLWVGLHAGAVPHDEAVVRSVLDQVRELVGLDERPEPLAPVVTGATDPVVDLDRPILCASLELMEEPGTTTLSLDDVSRRANVSLSSLRSTFTDVRQLVTDQIAFVTDDAAVDALPPDLPPATARVADQVNAFSSEPRATATLRLLTLTGLTREAARSSLDLGLYAQVDAAGDLAEVAPLRVALLALDALALSGERRVPADVHAALSGLTGL